MDNLPTYGLREMPEGLGSKSTLVSMGKWENHSKTVVARKRGMHVPFYDLYQIDEENPVELPPPKKPSNPDAAFSRKNFRSEKPSAIKAAANQHKLF
ncbi:hypothetical protein [Hugenholtzia roseola]|uniref:hypothetical protein n=1 Tax=Hugenholtzia roseola TaxID=1002 RepID=UPI0003FA2B0A|nr:hypothetical protein [Hugenholtzia roseola]